jgi:hypothetical protein
MNCKSIRTINQIRPGQTFDVPADNDGMSYTMHDDGSIHGEDRHGICTEPMTQESFLGAELRLLIA